ncbi:putative Xre family DNA-binding protein [Oscillibacter valericigenes Sjm18-20]|nr:putative Xre family DNA-binding protein [Oscillibacter valericigenes Sjm18-20]
MELGEKLKNHRIRKGLSQEQLAEQVGVSRQSVGKWESNQALPSSDNLLILASVFGTSLDELAEIKGQQKDRKILHSNLSLIAIAWNAAALNIFQQQYPSPEYGLSNTNVFFIKITLLLSSTIWMAFNLRYEKNPEQYRKNTRIELAYSAVQLIVTLSAYFSHFTFLGSVLILAICIGYVLWTNPKYMNRTFVKKKTDG